MRFPNLYTIRGTSYRDTYKWYKSVDEMRAYNPTYLVSSHGPYESAHDARAIGHAAMGDCDALAKSGRADLFPCD